MKRSTVMLLVCLVFFNSALIAYSYQNQHSINVVVDPGGGQSYNAEPASYAPASELFQTSAIPMLASGPETANGRIQTSYRIRPANYKSYACGVSAAGRMRTKTRSPLYFAKKDAEAMGA